MSHLDLVNLSALMERTRGRPDVRIGLIDGPVALDHPELTSENIREFPAKRHGRCLLLDSRACEHGTFVAGVLLGRRGSIANAICPACTLIVRPIFPEVISENGTSPLATAIELATAIVDCVNEKVRVINLSLALIEPSVQGSRELDDALDFAMQRGVLVVAAAGNQGTLGSTTIIRHGWTIPVISCGDHGQPLERSNLSASAGRRGVLAPGDGIVGFGPIGKLQLSGTSFAVPFVTGTIALIWSEFLDATPTQVRYAVTRTGVPRRRTMIPPLLDAWNSYRSLIATH